VNKVSVRRPAESLKSRLGLSTLSAQMPLGRQALADPDPPRTAKAWQSVAPHNATLVVPQHGPNYPTWRPRRFRQRRSTCRPARRSIYERQIAPSPESSVQCVTSSSCSSGDTRVAGCSGSVQHARHARRVNTAVPKRDGESTGGHRG